MVRSKAKEEKISTISNPARTQLPGVWAEEKIKKYELVIPVIHGAYNEIKAFARVRDLFPLHCPR